jgi:hypothetical protein
MRNGREPSLFGGLHEVYPFPEARLEKALFCI